jgi:hypothetical protein
MLTPDVWKPRIQIGRMQSVVRYARRELLLPLQNEQDRRDDADVKGFQDPHHAEEGDQK